MAAPGQLAPQLPGAMPRAVALQVVIEHQDPHDQGPLPFRRFIFPGLVCPFGLFDLLGSREAKEIFHHTIRQGRGKREGEKREGI